MGFPTLDDEDCLIRVPLAKFKWSDLATRTNGQTLKNKNLVTLAVQEATEAKLSQPYVKVGLIKANLIFRIKHKGGHWGEEDIVVVSGYRPPQPEGTSAAKLDPTAGPPAVDAGWWAKAGGEGVPGGGDLLNGLSGYALTAKQVEADDPPVTAFEEAEDELAGLQTAARGIMAALTHPDDQKLMLKFVKAIRDETERVGKRREKHVKGQAKAMSEAVDNYFDVLLGPAVEKAKREVVDFATKIKNGELEEANRLSARLFKIFDNRETKDGAVASKMKDQARVFNVDWHELLTVVRQDKRLESARKKYDEYEQTYEKFAAVLEKKEAELTDRESDHPERTTATDPVYKQHLAEINRDFKAVLQAIADAKREAERQTGVAKQLATAVAKGQTPGDLLSRVATVRNALANTMRDTISEYSKIRSNDGAVKVKEAQYGIKSEDKTRFTTPILNRCMAVWYQYRSAEIQALKMVAAALVGRVKQDPTDDAAMAALDEVKQELAKGTD
jgi:hypothetical protein